MTAWGLAERYPGAKDVGLRHAFVQAQLRGAGAPQDAEVAGSVLLLDDLDALFPCAEGEHGDSGAGFGDDAPHGVVGSLAEDDTLLVDEFASFVSALARRAIREPVGMFVLGVCCNPTEVNPRVRRAFQREVEFAPPAPLARQALFRDAFRPFIASDARSELVEAVDEAAASTPGFVAADVGATVSKAAHAALKRSDYGEHPELEPRDIALAASDPPFQLDLSSQGGLGGVQVSTPSVPWESVAGLDDVKRQLREVVVLPHTNPEAFERLGIDPPAGTLLFGVPGTGKTLLAQAVATECSANFVNITIAGILRSGVGDSEKAIATAFALAKRCAPCVLFIDEFQALFSSRDDEGGAAGGSLLTSQLLAEMSALEQARSAARSVRDRLRDATSSAAAGGAGGDASVGLDSTDGLGGDRVIVLAATNVPEAIDAAFLRAGRFDRVLHVPPPSQVERKALLQSIVAKMQTSGAIDCVVLARSTRLYTGADLSNLCRQAVLAALVEDENATSVQMRHFQKALLAARGSVSPQRLKQLNEWRAPTAA